MLTEKATELPEEVANVVAASELGVEEDITKMKTSGPCDLDRVVGEGRKSSDEPLDRGGHQPKAVMKKM